MDTGQLIAWFATNFTSLITSAVCIAWAIVILRSRTLPAAATRLGAAGFACLLLEALIGIVGQTAVISMRDSFESTKDLGLFLAVLGIFRLVLGILGVSLIAQAIFAGRTPQSA